MPDDLGEKTEDPTAKRRSEARDKGQVAKSADLSAAALMLFVAVYLVAFGGGLADQLAAVVGHAFDPAGVSQGITVQSLKAASGFAFDRLVGAATPVLLFVFLVAAASQFLQVGWHLTAKPLEPKLSNLNPGKGIKKTFSRRNAIKSGVDIVKVSVVMAVTVVFLTLKVDDIAALPLLATPVAVVTAGKIIAQAAAWVLAVLLIIGVADYLFQRWQHTQELRMSKHEVKEERKGAEGDPQVKARRFRFMQNLLSQQINAAVPQADVVVTNPTHFSVALKYDAETMSAPRVIAKGADHLAFRIRAVANAAGVPIVERPPLARALYYTVEPGQQIPMEHFEAVAELLAYVYRLDQKAAS